MARLIPYELKFLTMSPPDLLVFENYRLDGARIILASVGYDDSTRLFHVHPRAWHLIRHSAHIMQQTHELMAWQT